MGEREKSVFSFLFALLIFISICAAIATILLWEFIASRGDYLFFILLFSEIIYIVVSIIGFCFICAAKDIKRRNNERR